MPSGGKGDGKYRTHRGVVLALAALAHPFLAVAGE